MATRSREVKAAEPEPAVDMVNQPPHYQGDGVECIDAIRSMLGQDGFISFLRGTIVKYQWRMMSKDDPLENAQKAAWYEAKLRIELGELEGI